jgi:hypothetical protein
MSFWGGDCSHCGDPIETIGLDRVNSMGHYSIGNVERCCRDCNQMKSDRLTDDWYARMEKIRKHVGGFVGRNNRRTT